MPRSSKKIDELLHDIKSPLTSAIISCEEALDKDPLNENLRDVRESLKYIASLINADSGDERFSVREVISSSIKSAKKFSIDSCEINFSSPDNYIYGNTIKFKRVIDNILLNAIEALATNIVIRVEIVMANSENASTVVKISDNGPGIMAGDLEKVFDNGFSTKDKTMVNSGLGLYICKSIIEKDFGGQISVESKIGRDHGTTFTLVFP